MSSEKHWNQRTGREKLVYLAARIAFWIPVFVFILLSNILVLWVTKPFADSIAVLVSFLPFYWVAPDRKFGFATYAGCAVILASAVFVTDHFFIH